MSVAQVSSTLEKQLKKSTKNCNIALIFGQIGEKGMKFNAAPTKAIVISNEENKTALKTGNDEIEQVDTINYLGKLIQRKRWLLEEINDIMPATKLFCPVRNDDW